MRGDSLRDFYAKALALLGLGVLAGVGALVDYWPASLDIPRQVAGPLALPAPAQLPVLTPASLDTWSSVRPAPRQTQRKAVVYESIAATPAEAVLDGTVTVDLVGVSPISEPRQEAAAPVSDPVSVEPVDAIDPALPVTDELGFGHLVAPTLQADNGDAGGGMFTGAFKKTGHTIVKGGVKTGASIVDAMRAVSGAFKRVWPL